MAALRLAIVTPRFWPLVGDRPTHLLRLAESLTAIGHQPVVVTPQWKRTWPREMTIGPVPLIRLRGSGRSGWSTLRWMYSLGTWLRDQTLDGVIVDGLRHEAYTALAAARRRQSAIALIAGDDDLAWHKSATLGSRIAARCHEAPAVIAPSVLMFAALSAAGFAADRIHVVPRTCLSMPLPNPAMRDAARAALAAVNADLVLTAKATVALAVGRLDAEHRFSDLIRAWRIVTARQPEARLWIVGDGPEREQLYRQIGDLDQRFRVVIPGTFDWLEELIQASDMLLVPSPHSVPPMALLDAQAAGLPVVAVQSPMAAGLVKNGETGFAYPLGDVKALAAAVLELIERPAIGIQVGAAARALAAMQPTPADEARAYIEIMSRLADRR
ncbi:MAG TPA: glycosyltransferase family 4 protein [Pirellulaceae bacterium]|jgi:glycosyltransferase involved in cell wall biosynthesis